MAQISRLRRAEPPASPAAGSPHIESQFTHGIEEHLEHALPKHLQQRILSRPVCDHAHLMRLAETRPMECNASLVIGFVLEINQC